ncbi:MAG: hypothetical protein EpisKO_32840 [Epibacterium sp.]
MSRKPQTTEKSYIVPASPSHQSAPDPTLCRKIDKLWIAVHDTFGQVSVAQYGVDIRTQLGTDADAK